MSYDDFRAFRSFVLVDDNNNITDNDTTTAAAINTNPDLSNCSINDNSKVGSDQDPMAAIGHSKLCFNISSWCPTRDEWILANRLVQRDEAKRISAFVFKRDAKASMAGRLLMRRCLVDSLRQNNAKLNLTRTSDGRPVLTEPVANFDFNISHQGDFCAATSGRCKCIGIDIMQMKYTGGRHVTEFFRLMRRQFTQGEWQFIKTPSFESQQIARFYRLWTLKESYVKAVGIGLGMDLQRINFRICDELRLGQELTSTSVEVDGHLDAKWTFHECLLDSTHCVAIASVGLRGREHFSLPAMPATIAPPTSKDQTQQESPTQAASVSTCIATDSANSGCYVQMDFYRMVRGLDPRDELSPEELTKLWAEFCAKEERPS